MIEIIKPSHKILTEIDGQRILKNLEMAARVCYKSEDKATEDSAERLIKRILDSKHESVIEHESISVRFICDKRMQFILPPWCGPEFLGEFRAAYVNFEDHRGSIWIMQIMQSATNYNELINEGWTPQQARTVLPNSLKTELVMTANLREWSHILKLRTAKAAHPQMRELMIPLLKEFKAAIPVIFDDIDAA